MFATAQSNLSPGQLVGMATHGSDAGLYVEFSMRPVHMPFKSEQAGRPIFEDQAYITIRFPGDKTKTVERPVILEDTDRAPSDPARFPRHWAAFQAQESQVSEGMPITEWPPLTKSQAQELKAINIHTVEQLAHMPDSGCNWMGARELRKKAIAWLDFAAGHSKESALQAVIDSQQAQIEALRKQVEDIAAKAAAKAAAKDDTAPKTRRTAATTEG